MNKILRTVKIGLAASLLLAIVSSSAYAQEKLTQDTMECHIFGFNFGTVFADGNLSYAKDPATGINNEYLTMSSMYKAPYLNFGISPIYKFKSNWLVTLDGNMWIGTDNLKDRTLRLQGIYNSDSIIMAVNGVDGVYTCYNRGINVKAGIGKVIVTDKRNPNSGVLLTANAGWMMNKTVFSQDINEAPAYQLAGDYLVLYDQKRSGAILSEGIGYWFMSNKLNLVNMYAMFEVSQCWTHSTRDYTIDTQAGLRGKDNSRHFDLLYSIKLCWMFPLKGKTVYDFYYY